MPILLVLLGAIVYANSFGGAFVFDDHANILENRVVRGAGTIGDHLRGPRPALSASLALNYAWGGPEVRGYHVFNLTVHLAATLLLFGIVRRTLRFGCVPNRYQRHADAIAFCVALLWCLHPLQTESVTYIVQRSESMMSCCFLFCLYCLARGADARRAWPWHAASLVAFGVGLASKEVMVVAPGVMLLYDRAFLTSSWKDLWSKRGWLYGVYALLFILAFLVNAPRIAGGESAGFSMAALTPWQYLRSQPGVLLHYLRLSLWPTGLCLDYAWPVADGVWSIVLPGLVVIALIGASFYSLWRWPGLGFLGVAFFLILAPTTSILPINDLAVEHRMYLPLAAVIMLVALACWELLSALSATFPARAAIGLMLVAALVLGSMTMARNKVYRDPLAMWADVIAKAPHNARAYTNLGELLADAGQLDDAVVYLRQGVALRPTLAQAHANIARVLLMKGSDLSLAQQHAAVAVQLEPTSARFRQQFGLVATKRRDYREAARQFREALALDSGDPLLHVNLGQCLADQQDFDGAVASYQTAIELEPRSSEPRVRLIGLLLERDRLDEALAQSRECVEQCGNEPVAHRLLGQAYERLDRLPEALEAYRAALRLDPRDAEACYHVGDVYRKQQDYAAATRSYLEAVSARPDFAEAHNNLAGLFLMSRRPDKAIDHYEAALRAAPTYYQARYNLALILTQQARLEEAAEQYRLLLKNHPDFKPARENLERILILQQRGSKARAS